KNNVGWQATQTNDVNIHIFRYADMLRLLAEAEIHATTGILDNARTIVNQIRARAGKVAQGCGTADTLVTKAWPACVTNDTIKPMAVPMYQGANSIDSLTTPWAKYRIGLYTLPFASAAQADQAVQYERRLELAMEGQRFFDLRRWRTANTEINNYVTVEGRHIPYLAGVAYTARDSLYPIPSNQLDLAPLLVQNPGWCARANRFGSYTPAGNRRGSPRARPSLPALSRRATPPIKPSPSWHTELRVDLDPVRAHLHPHLTAERG